MLHRRSFVQSTTLLGGLSLLSGTLIGRSLLSILPTYISGRPPVAKRKFTSPVIEAHIRKVKTGIADPELAWLFENCFPNTLDTTVTHHGMLDGKLDTFIITGDINALWLRDSSAQVYPYLPFITQDAKLKALIQGLINRHTRCVLIDPYANAFNYDRSKKSQWYSDDTDMKPELHERKWEVDSLCYVIRLAHGYWQTTGDTSLFDEQWVAAMKTIIRTFIAQQRKTSKGPYHFQRKTLTPTDTLTNKGYGPSCIPTGMICSMFRPSDDATTYPYLIPSNLFAVTSLRQLAEMMKSIQQEATAADCTTLAAEIDEAIKKYGIVPHGTAGNVYAYEVDGLGASLLIDEPNMPNLLSLPYFDAKHTHDGVYLNTRQMLFSTFNPYYIQGKSATGLGSSHTRRGYIWHLSLIAQALTSTDAQEIKTCIAAIKASNAGTGFMHESFDADHPTHYSRSWFAWANTLFGELITKVYAERPELLK